MGLGEGSAAPPRLSAPPPHRGRFPWRGLGGAPPRGTAALPAYARGGLRARDAGRAKPAQPSGGGSGAGRARGSAPQPGTAQGEVERGRGGAPRCPRVSAGAERCRRLRGCGLGGSAEALRAALPRSAQDSCDGFQGSGNQTRASGPNRAARGVGVFEDFSPRRAPAPAVGMDNTEL